MPVPSSFLPPAFRGLPFLPCLLLFYHRTLCTVHIPLHSCIRIVQYPIFRFRPDPDPGCALTRPRHVCSGVWSQPCGHHNVHSQTQLNTHRVFLYLALPVSPETTPPYHQVRCKDGAPFPGVPLFFEQHPANMGPLMPGYPTVRVGYTPQSSSPLPATPRHG